MNNKKEFSIYRYQYWMQKYAMSEIDAKLKVSSIQKQNSNKSKNKIKPEYSHFKKEYWIIKKGFTEPEAVKKVSELQSALSKRSSKFKGKIRTTESKIKISNSMKAAIAKIGNGKWARHFGEFNGNSKIEKEFYLFIKENLNGKVQANVPISYYIVDTLCDNKVVEFYGDFWHANPKFYSGDEVIKSFSINKTVNEIWSYDADRIDNLNKLGYNVLVIWENDWIKNKKDCVEKIKRFYEINN
jgi:very-short-patch-repair endonuclease